MRDFSDEYRPKNSQEGLRKLIISNFHPATTEQELFEMFEEYGIERVILKPAKYAVIIFDDCMGALKAKDDFTGCMYYGYSWRIKYPDQPVNYRRFIETDPE